MRVGIQPPKYPRSPEVHNLKPYHGARILALSDNHGIIHKVFKQSPCGEEYLVMSKQGGFTFIELLLLIAIGVLGSAILYRALHTEEARVNEYVQGLYNVPLQDVRITCGQGDAKNQCTAKYTDPKNGGNTVTTTVTCGVLRCEPLFGNN